MNSLRSGLYAKFTLMPGEDPFIAKETMRAWICGFSSRTIPAAHVAKSAADAWLRHDRLEALREKLLAEILERRVAESEAAKTLALHRETRQVVAALVETVTVVAEPISRERTAVLLGPVRRVAEAINALDLPATLARALTTAASPLASDDVTDVDPDVFHAIARAGRQALLAIDAGLDALGRVVDQERERQATRLAFADDPELRALDRVKGRILRELDSYMRLLTAMRELERATDRNGAEAPAIPVVVEFRVPRAAGVR